MICFQFEVNRKLLCIIMLQLTCILLFVELQKSQGLTLELKDKLQEVADEKTSLEDARHQLEEAQRNLEDAVKMEQSERERIVSLNNFIQKRGEENNM